MATGVKLWSSCSAEDLQDIQDAQVHECAPLGVVDLGALDDDGVGRQVHTPGQSGSANQDLKILFVQFSS